MCLHVPKNFQSPRIFCPKVFSVHEKGWEPQKGGDRKKGGDGKKVGDRKKDLDGKKVGDRKKYWNKKRIGTEKRMGTNEGGNKQKQVGDEQTECVQTNRVGIKGQVMLSEARLLVSEVSQSSAIARIWGP